MPITQTIDHFRRRTTTLVTGPVHLADVEAHWRTEVAERGEAYPELVDAREATLAFGTAEVRRIVHLIRSTRTESTLGPTAVVVRTDVGSGMVRMFGLMLEPECEIVPFRDMRTAEAWLESFDSRGDATSRGAEAEIA